MRDAEEGSGWSWVRRKMPSSIIVSSY